MQFINRKEKKGKNKVLLLKVKKDAVYTAERSVLQETFLSLKIRGL